MEQMTGSNSINECHGAPTHLAIYLQFQESDYLSNFYQMETL